MIPDWAFPNSAELAPVVTEASSNELVPIAMVLPPDTPPGLERLPGSTGTPSTYVAASARRGQGCAHSVARLLVAVAALCSLCPVVLIARHQLLPGLARDVLGRPRRCLERAVLADRLAAQLPHASGPHGAVSDERGPHRPH